MANRPSILAARMSDRSFSDGGLLQETFRLPVDAARIRAREIFNQPQDGYSTIVEKWRQLPDGQIEFTMRRHRISD